MEKDYTIKVVPLDIIREKHAAAWEQRAQRDAERKQAALDYYSNRVLSDLEGWGFTMQEADTWDDYQGFNTQEALWALDKIEKAYQELGYNVSRMTFSKSYHVKLRLFITANVYQPCPPAAVCGRGSASSGCATCTVFGYEICATLLLAICLESWYYNYRKREGNFPT